jgi:TonB-dependent starch-binding outer membrane protein SusC
MKILCILLTVASLQLAARGYSQGISITLKNAPLEKVFQLVEKQSAYSFVYSKEALALAKPVSIDVKNETVENVLRLCFINQPLGYAVNGKFIIIKIPDKGKGIAVENTDLRGKVVNENGDPLAGVTITVKNSGQATSSNDAGEFFLKDVPEQAVLVVTSIGYHMEEVPVNNKAYLFIQLTTLVGSLDETIVKGYYSTSKKLNTGSVSKVTAKEISQQPVTNPLAALEGRVPGLLITQQSGVPGTGFNILIRGRNSINNGTSPLYVIDGVPFLNDDDAPDLLTQRGVYGNRPSPFNSISPEDIESIEVLKDADATSIYGSRGANGVILITTKKAKAGKTSVTASAYYGWSRVTKAPEYMNTQQYLEMRHEAFRNDGVAPTLSNAKDLLIWDTTRYTNLRDVLIGGTACTFNSTVRMTAGNEYTRISGGVNYYTEGTAFPGDKSVSRMGPI